jgi:hypothetical protein
MSGTKSIARRAIARRVRSRAISSSSSLPSRTVHVERRDDGAVDRKFQLRDRYIVDLGGDHDKRVDRRLVIALAIGLDALQNR